MSNAAALRRGAFCPYSQGALSPQYVCIALAIGCYGRYNATTIGDC